MSTSSTAVAGPEADDVEERRLRKAAKQTAKEAAAAAADEAVVEEGEEAEAKRQRKAAKRAAKEAAAAFEAPDDAVVEEGEEAEAKRRRKAAKRAAKEAGDEEEEAPKVKKSKTGEGGIQKSIGEKEDKGSHKVFIRGLSFSKDEATLRQDFSKCGEVTDFQVPIDKEGRPKGYVFITFAGQAGFDAALELNNTEYGGRKITIVEQTDGGKGQGKQRDWNCPNCDDVVFARNAHCRQCGTARPGGGGNDAKVKSNGKEGEWRCPSCDHIVFARNSTCRKCGAKKPGGGDGNENENTVFVRGLPGSVTEDTLQKHFAKCGEIVGLKLPLKAGKPNGISFIKYASQESMDAALKLHNTDYGGKTISVCKAVQGGKGKSKDGQGGKGKAKDDGAMGKAKGKGKAVDESFRASFSKKTGCIVAGAGEKTTFADSDEE